MNSTKPSNTSRTRKDAPKTARERKTVSGQRKGLPFKVERREGRYGTPDDWLIRETRKDHVNCCEFKTEQEAKDAALRWNNGDGMAVFETWIAPPEDADDSHRGWYLIHVRGAGLVQVFGGGWHEDYVSALMVAKLRDAVAEHGLKSVRDSLNAVESRKGWAGYGKHSREQATRLRGLAGKAP